MTLPIQNYIGEGVNNRIQNDTGIGEYGLAISLIYGLIIQLHDNNGEIEVYLTIMINRNCACL